MRLQYLDFRNRFWFKGILNQVQALLMSMHETKEKKLKSKRTAAEKAISHERSKQTAAVGKEDKIPKKRRKAQSFT